MNFEVLLVAKMIRDAKLTQPVREKITACVFYNQPAGHDIDFKKRFKLCKRRLAPHSRIKTNKDKG